MTAEYRVFWQPGCSSCLRAKEFLTKNGIAFQSINVRVETEAMDELARWGVRSIPVVARGDAFVLGQDLDELAAFVGITLDRVHLAPAELVARINALLLTAGRHVVQLPQEDLATPLPGRDRTLLDLAFHVGMIPWAFLVAARGETLVFEFFDRRAPADKQTPNAVRGFLDGVRDDVATWWAASGDQMPETVSTYYGEQPTKNVLERTAWHAAQHCRQLQAVLEQRGIAPDGPLGDAELAGLPLPDEIYDDEVGLTATGD
ncbi:MAG: NrdH-redoxin [Alphaproteobacteria bacterium]|jgi:glutaredoxin|nr:NrdH-redoxin [Alphaproteobacteria bacterium]